MTWRLIAGQLRAHRGYFAWTASLLAILVAVLTFMGVAGATQATLSQRGMAVLGQDADRYANLLVTPAPVEGLRHSVSQQRLRELVDSTPAASALASVLLATKPIADLDVYDWEAEVWAISKYGGADHNSLISKGRLPQEQGEVALSADVARALGAGVGSEVTLYGQSTGADGFAMDVPHSFTVVGISASRELPGYDSYFAPGALLSWDEVESGGAFTDEARQVGFEDTDVSRIDLRWSGGSALIDPYLEFEYAEWRGDFQLPQSTAIWFVVAVVLVIAMIIMSFAVGRSQAAARTQWIATVRTMGATRGYIAAATVLETVVIAAIAAVVGISLGVVAAQAQLSVARASVEAPFGPSTVTAHWLIFPVVTLVALVVALLIAAVPAFWASRITPVAALKPVNDVTETELSRRVSPHWLWIPLVLGVGSMILGSTLRTAGIDLFVFLGAIVAGLTTAALMIEANRWAIPHVGRQLARSRKPSRMTAGDALRVRPKQAVAPALLTTAAVATLTMMVTVSALDPHGMVRVFGYGYTAGYGDYTNNLSEALSYWWSALVAPTTVLAVILAALAIQLVAASMFVAHRTATAREGATRRALGLTARHLTRAHWWQQWAPQVTGALVGLVVGLAGGEAWRLLNVIHGAEGYDSIPGALRALALVAALGAVAIMLLTGALTSWLVARTGSRATPLGQALRAH